MYCQTPGLGLGLGVDFTFTWRIIPRPLLDYTTSTLGLYHVHPWIIPRPPLDNTTSTQNPHLAYIRRKGPTCLKIWSSILLCDLLPAVSFSSIVIWNKYQGCQFSILKDVGETCTHNILGIWGQGPLDIYDNKCHRPDWHSCNTISFTKRRLVMSNSSLRL